MIIDIEEIMSGKDTGKFFGDSLLYNIKRGNRTEINITTGVHVNDSFWKGFFEESMYHYKDSDVINNHVTIIGTDFQKKNVKDNLRILTAIVNA